MKTPTQRLEKIARNINAMDLNYQYIDQYTKYSFWAGLRIKLFSILKELSETEKQILSGLCKKENAAYFGLAI